MAQILDFETLPGFLQGESLRNWLRTDGAGIFSAFSTGIDALEFARELGVSIRTSDFYQIRREVLAQIESAQPLFGYPDNQLIPYAWHETNHGMDFSTEFTYRVHEFGRDRNTGVLRDQWVSVASDRIMTRNEIIETARQYVGERGDSDRITDVHYAEIEPLRMS